MDSPKAFDTINHELLIAKLSIYGFSKSSITLMNSYLTKRLQRISVHNNFRFLKEILSRISQGSF